MKIVILNSGMGTRLGDAIRNSHKCLLKLNNETIISRQLRMLNSFNISNIIITTGFNNKIVEEYCKKNFSNIKFNFVYNEKYDSTNYIYSIYKCNNLINDDDIILIHGDLVFNANVFARLFNSQKSVMTVSSTKPLPNKDFKAEVMNGRITKVGINCFNNALYAQPLYKILKDDWKIWFDKIISFCENNNCNCYAENAFNEVSDKCKLFPLDIKDDLCSEIDNLSDLSSVLEVLNNE